MSIPEITPDPARTLDGAGFLRALDRAGSPGTIPQDVAVVVIDSSGTQPLGTTSQGRLILPLTRIVYNREQSRLELYTEGQPENTGGPVPVLRPPVDPDAADGGVPLP